MLAWRDASALYGNALSLQMLTFTSTTADSSALDFLFLQNFLDIAQQLYGERLPKIRLARRKIESISATAPQLAFLPFDENTDSILSMLPPASISIIMASADQTQALPAWRKAIVDARPDLRTLGPCGSEFENDLPDACSKCSIARHIAIHPSRLSAHFEKLLSTSGKGITAKMQFNQPFSYVVLQGGHDTALPDNDWMKYEPFSKRNAFRYIGSSINKHEVIGSPDSIAAMDSEYLRLCPGHGDLTKLALHRTAGKVVPPLRFGDVLRAYP